MRLSTGPCALALMLCLTSSCSDPAPAAPDGAVDAAQDLPATPPRLLVSPTSVDFGAVDCGGTPSSQTLTLTNLGQAPLTWSATLPAGTGFALSGATSGSIAAQASAKLVISGQALSASATPGQALTATLTLDTNDADLPRHTVALSVTPTGGTLTLAPSKVDLGLIPVGANSADQPLTLTNSGDKALTVTIGQPTDKQFSLSWDGAPAVIKLEPTDSVDGLVARFAPTKAGAAASSAALAVTGAVCGASATSIALAGEGSAGLIAVQPGSLDFGKVDCGKTAAAQTLKVQNSGKADFNLTAALGGGGASPYSVSPTTAKVVAGGSVTLTVTPKQVPATSLTSADHLADTLTLTSTIPGDVPHLIKLHQTPHGARLTLSQSVIAFGDVPIKTTLSSPLTLSNAGNAPATVTLTSAGTAFSVSPSAAIQLGAGNSLAVSATFAPATAKIESGSVTLTTATSDVLCAPLPTQVALFGTGTNGALSLSDTALDFGETGCGATAAPQNLTLKNTGSGTFSYTAALTKGAGSPYTIAPSSGTLAPWASATIKVSPKAIPAVSATTPGGYDDTLTITTSGIVGDTPHSIQLSQSADGVILAFPTGTAIAMGNVPAGSSSLAAFSLTNKGSATVAVSLAISNPLFTLDDLGPLTLWTSDVHAGDVDFSPTAAGAQAATVTLSVPAGTVLCAPLPKLTVSATGTKGTVALSTSQLDFGLVNCGSQAAAKSVVISNTGTAAFNFTADLAGTAAEAYTLSAASGKVDPGKQVTLTVTPPKVPADSAVTANLYGDLLTVGTDVFGDADHTIPIHMTARGAILTVTPEMIAFSDTAVGSSRNQSFTVQNTGNAPAAVSFNVTSSVFSITPQAHQTPATSGYNATAYFTPAAASAYTETVQLTVPAGTAICDTLPTIDLDGDGI